MKERDLVLSMLMEIEKENEFSHILIRQVLDKYNYLEANQKGFIKRLTEGTLERRLEMDYIINQFSKIKTAKMKPLIRNLLRMSVYQIFYMEHIPHAAVCNEAVKLAALHKFSSLKGFVNGTLRNIVRNKGEIEYPKKEDNFLQYLEITYSLPQWIIEELLKQYTKEQVEEISKGLLEKRPFTIRFSPQLEEKKKEELIKKWEERGVITKPHPYLSYAYYLERTEGITFLEGFLQGEFVVQDVSSMLVAEIAEIKENMFILDVCAAPGGKATHGAIKLNHTGCVLARDLTEYKVNMIEESATRQKLDNIKTQVWDGTIFDETLEKRADIVFCDVPCSGLGVMTKKTDLKYRIQKQDLESLTLLQRKIIENAVRYLKPGGTLIYSTCTIHQKENEEQVQWMIENLGMKIASMKENLPSQLEKEEGKLGLQLLPGIHETDGFFLAKLKKEN